MRTVELEVSQIEPNPKNYRRTFLEIEKLAESIATHGLLQNLVVIEYAPGKYHVHAGERRYRAILMLCQQLDTYGQPRWQWPVRCVVVSQFGTEDYAENDEDLRHRVALWQVGERYARDYETGVDQTTLAVKFGKTQTHISQALRFHYKICSKVKKMIDRLGPDALNVVQLLQLSKILDEHGDPLEDEQIVKCIEFLGKDRRKPMSRPGSVQAEKERIVSRVKNLETKRVPLHAKPYVDIMIGYLKGERRRLKF